MTNRANPDQEPTELSYQLLTRLQGFIPESEGYERVVASFEWIDHFEISEEDQRDVDEQINEAWCSFVLLTADRRSWFYDIMLSRLEKEEFNDIDSARKTAKLAELFAFRKASLESSYALRNELRMQHNRVLELLRKWIAKGQTESLSQTIYTSLSNTAAALFEVYFNHPHYMDDDDLRSEAAALLPKLIRTFYPACHHVHIYMLGYHTCYAQEFAGLIDFYLKLDQPKENKGKAYLSLATSFIGEDAAALELGIRPVLQKLELDMPTWSDREFDEFIEDFIYDPLRRQPLLQITRSNDRRLVLDLVIAQHRQTALAAKASETLRQSQVIIAQIEEHTMPSPKNGSKGVEFVDFNFKLAVIEELMYKQKRITPRFDVVVFVQEYALREISIAEEGDRAIPEVREYFERLILTEEDLAHVTKLVVSTGQQVQLQIIPFWNGEDGYFDVHSLEDLQHVPNLRVLQTVKLLKADPAPAIDRGLIWIQD
ncbi:hypothetical protein [Saccharibacillus sp. JS10]|uniref:DUF6892 domain-containing protein n=1 Tax=Saccharibacillus sp. JS10 TaxID=2950552 RepID=UPI002109C7A3|nr:hypothetical protein [Saccharibacillus sp. JS10]MCQ4085504.1 hypothetical protein [Saccharibacillus sp. JS10]